MKKDKDKDKDKPNFYISRIKGKHKIRTTKEIIEEKGYAYRKERVGFYVGYEDINDHETIRFVIIHKKID